LKLLQDWWNFIWVNSISLKPFHFKEFIVHQNHSVLKVGTDAMILGAFAKANAPTTILDIGSGTGVLALMMAQKFADARITALDLDAETLIDCQQNIMQSPWAQRMTWLHVDFLTFHTSNKFDLIICNPPFYEQSLRSANQRVNAAKHTSEDFLLELFAKTKELLSPTGIFWLILPIENFDFWKKIAGRNKLYIQDEIVIYSKIAIPKRCVASFTHTKKSISSKLKFVIRNQDNSYTQEYVELTKKFHNKKL